MPTHIAAMPYFLLKDYSIISYLEIIPNVVVKKTHKL